MKRFGLLFVMSVPLAACNKGPEVNLKNASGQQVAQAVSQSGVVSGDYMIDPGEWVSKVTVQEMNFPGMPPQFQEQMKKAIASRQSEGSKHCVTPADAKKPKEDFFAGKDNSCRFAHFTMGGGRMDIQMVCQEEGGTRTSNMSGTYTPTNYSMDVSSNMSGGAQSGAAMKMHVDAQRIGDCSGKDS